MYDMRDIISCSLGHKNVVSDIKSFVFLLLGGVTTSRSYCVTFRCGVSPTSPVVCSFQLHSLQSVEVAVSAHLKLPAVHPILAGEFHSEPPTFQTCTCVLLLLMGHHDVSRITAYLMDDFGVLTIKI